ncbi:MAG: DUF4153 domain-containing protein [bacterium]
MNFKFISIKKIIDGIKTAIHRFPMAILTAAIGTMVGIILIHVDEPSFYPSILMALALGFPLFISIVLLGEQRKWEFNKKVIANSAAITFLIGYYFWLPNNIFEAQSLFIIRYIMWAIGFILLITFVPFFKKNDEKTVDTFWHYNKTLAYSIMLTIIWAFAIQAGISVALSSVSFLFNINIAGERYMELWVVIVGFFSTAFFLSRIPKDTQYPEETDIYPKELRLFSQYVLVPLTTLYFLILYAYVIRIFVLWEWPKGILAYMILGFSLLGVFTYVCLYPLRDKISWVKKTGKIFYIVLIPQVGMLFWALWFRISEYGITENRYLVFVFGWWLLGMAIYFLVSKKKDIRIIPITIFIIALLSSFGPWGAFSVSEKSQVNRLKNLLEKNNILIDNVIKKSTTKVAFEDEKEISATISYLNSVHGLDSIQPWFDVDLAKLDNNKGDERDYYSSYALPEKIVEKIIGIDYVGEWEDSSQEDKYFNFYADDEESGKLFDVSQYNYMMGFNTIDTTKTIDGVDYHFKIDNDTNNFIILKNGDLIAQTNLNEFLDKLSQQGDQDGSNQDEMIFEFKNENISFALNFNYISGEKNEDGYIVTSMNSEMFFVLNE